MQTNEISPTPTVVNHTEDWVAAAYGRVGSVTNQYRNIVFTPESEARVMMIAGWITGLLHAGQVELAEKIAEDINSNLEYLNGYGGTEQAAFEDGSAVLNVPRYMVSIGDDGSFGGFTVNWYRAFREGGPEDVDRSGMLRNRWDSLVDNCRWGQQTEGPREVVKFLYRFSMNGGLLYHGPGGGETFSVNVGTPRFWSIHT